MCGSLDSSLGVRLDILIPRWRDGKVTRNELETTGRMQFNALLIKTSTRTGLATAAQAIQQVIS
jgi:calcineurin-like phosphoesterase